MTRSTPEGTATMPTRIVTNPTIPATTSAVDSAQAAIGTSTVRRPRDAAHNRPATSSEIVAGTLAIATPAGPSWLRTVTRGDSYCFWLLPVSFGVTGVTAVTDPPGDGTVAVAVTGGACRVTTGTVIAETMISNPQATAAATRTMLVDSRPGRPDPVGYFLADTRQARVQLVAGAFGGEAVAMAGQDVHAVAPEIGRGTAQEIDRGRRVDVVAARRERERVLTFA